MTAVYDPEQLDKKERADVENPDPKDNQAADNSSDPRDLDAKEAEPAQHENQVGDGYTATGKATKSKFSGLLGTRNRKLVAGGGLAAGIIALVIAAFLALLPLKILHIVDNLQSRFYATSENAVQKETDQLLSRYIRTTLSKCKNVVDSSCNPYTGGTLVQNLYRGWRNARLEEKLKTKYGIEFKYDNNKKIYYLKTPNIPGDGVNMAEFMNNPDMTVYDFVDKSPEFKQMSRGDIRQAVRTSFEGETRYKRVMYKYKVGRLLEQKYGIKRCIVACKAKDTFADWKEDKKRAFRLYLTQRVLQPRSEMLGLMMECVLSPSCTADTVINATPQVYEADKTGCKEGCAQNGESNSAEDRIMRQRVLALVASYGSDKVALDAVYKRLAEKGFVRYISEELLQKILKSVLTQEGKNTAGKLAGQLASKLPLIGAVITAHYWVDTIDKMPAILQKLSYVANSTAMVDMYTMYRTHTDEIKEGKVDAAMVGSFVTALGPGEQVDEGSDEQVGGTAEAEQTPLYQGVVGTNRANPLTSSLGKIFSGKALAADATQNPTYTCVDNKPVPAGRLACEDMNLNHTGWFQQLLDKVIHSKIWTLGIKPLSDAVGKVLSLLKAAVGVVCLIPGLCSALNFILNQLVSFLESLVAPLLRYIGDFVLNILGVNIHMVSSKMSGGRTFDLLAGGADVSGNDFAHSGTGGVKLTPAEAQTNLAYYYRQQYENYQQKSFIARMFDTETPYSLTSRLAMAMPTSPNSSIRSSFSSFITNPISKLTGFMYYIFSNPVAAAVPAAWGTENDPFGITQYGYPLDDPVFKQDPDAYWQKYCTSTSPTNLTSLWNQYAADITKAQNYDLAKQYGYLPTNLRPGTFPSEAGHKLAAVSPNGTNGCLLIQSAVGSAGAAFTSSVLTPDDLAGSTTNANPTTTPGGIGTTTSGFTFPLATTQAVVKAGSSGSVWCYTSSTNCHHDYNAADIFAPTGTQVISPASCSVTTVHDTIDPQWASGDGSRVSLKCDDGRTYYMAHMGRGTLVVKVGQHVSGGDPIGKVGTAADAEGTVSHLHIDALPASQYDSRPGCANSACLSFPFINLQPDLVKAFGSLP